MDELRDVRAFAAIGRSGSFVGAAKALNVPTSTLSRRIALLEGSLGMPLLRRSTRKVELTTAGRLYLARCEQIIEQADLAREELRSHAISLRGRIRISATPDFASIYLAPVLTAFTQASPGVDLQLDLTPRHVDLAIEDFDLAFRVGRPRHAALIARRILLARQGLFASPDAIDRWGPLRTPQDLAQTPCLAVSHPERVTTWTLHKGTQTVEVSLGPAAITANNPRFLTELALQGAGIVCADKRLAGLAERWGQLVQILPDWEPAPTPIYAVTADRVLPLRTRALLDFTSRALAKADERMDVNHVPPP